MKRLRQRTGNVPESARLGKRSDLDREEEDAGQLAPGSVRINAGSGECR